MIKINDYFVDVQKLPAFVDGVSYIPQIRNFGESANDEDSLSFTSKFGVEVTQANYQLTEDLTRQYAKKGIVEIGVHRNGEGSFTWAMIKNKPKNVVYLGIDVEDRSSINDKENNVYTIQANSWEQERIRKYMKEIGLNEISILFIDGHHSVNTVVNDWRYSDLLDREGIVMFHDTNYHPGPLVFLDAIDPKKYKVHRYFTDGPADYGIGVAYRIG